MILTKGHLARFNVTGMNSAKFWSGLFLSYGKSSYFTKRMLIGIRCIMILTQGQLVKLKVIRKKEFIICFRSLPFL